MKKYLLFLVAVMLANIGRAAVGDTFEYDGLNYTILSEDDLTVEVKKKSYYHSGHRTIPAQVTHNGISYTVTAIGENAFSGCNELTSVTIPNSVTTIGKKAFVGTGLTSMTIPNPVTSIGDSAFEGCRGLTSVTILNSVTTIGEKAFEGCLGLKWVTIPNSVTSIGDRAFYWCGSLTSVRIPNSVTSIGNNAFGNCSSLSEIYVEKSSKYFSSEDGVLYNYDKTTLIQCPGAKTKCIIPETVTSIGNCAFYCCKILTSVTIPNSVTSIGTRAFSYCSVLTSITIPNSVTTIGSDAFYACTGLTSVIIGKSVTSIGSYAFDACPLVKVIDLNPSPQSIYKVFTSIADDAVLYVPSGSVEAYKAAQGWSAFSDIRGMGAFEVALSAETLEIAEGEYAKIDVKIVKDDDVAVESEEWSSSDTAVAVVKDGVVTAVAPGKAVITYTAVDSYGAPHKAMCVVTVTEGQNGIGVIGDDADATVDVYTLQGVAVLRNAPVSALRTLPAGIYIIRQNKTTRKIAVK